MKKAEIELEQLADFIAYLIAVVAIRVCLRLELQ